MITKTINEKEYVIPQSWADVTVGVETSMLRLVLETAPELKQNAIIAGYLQVPIEEINTMHESHVQSIREHLAFSMVKPDNKAQHEVTVNGVEYTILPTLLNGESRDFVTISHSLKQNKDKEHESLSYILAILCKKKYADGRKETLDDYDPKDRALEMDNMPMSTAHALYVFFWAIFSLYSKNSKHQLHELNQSIQQQMLSTRNTVKTLDSMGLSGRLLNGILQKSLSSLDKTWAKYYSSIK